MISIVALPGSLCDSRLFASVDLGPAEASIADFGAADTITGMADAVLSDAPDRFVAVGLSLGAIVAVEMAALAPERVTALVVLDTNLAPVDPAQTERRRRWEFEVEAGRFSSVVDELVPAMTTDPVTHGSLITDMAHAVGPAAFLRQNHALLHRSEDRRPTLAQYRGPVFVGYGSHDAICPPALHAALAFYRSDAELVAFDGAGHLVALDRPEALSAALRPWIETVQHQPTMEEQTR